MKRTENIRDKRREQREENQKKFDKAVRRNWIILIASFAVILGAYFITNRPF